ncbi:MAG: hypothetical protein HWD86_01025 [Kangiellaceae bacterium]|nr:hypothetical protein [Kangiellaceae bacterium]
MKTNRLTITFQSPILAWRCVSIAWLLMAVTIFCYFIFNSSSPRWAFMLMNGAVCFLIIGMGYVWSARQFRQLYQDYIGLEFYDKQWFLLEQGNRGDGERRGNAEQSKLPIIILSSTALWPLWIKLDFRIDTLPSQVQPNPAKKSLVIFRDALSEHQFRELSRTLRFYKRPISG